VEHGITAGSSSSSLGRRQQQQRRSRQQRRVLSPPMLPPRWGQDVAPPPTPFFTSPETSPVHRHHSEPIYGAQVQQLQQEQPQQPRNRHRCGHDHNRSRRRQREQQQEFRLHQQHDPVFLVPAPPMTLPNPNNFLFRRHDSASSLTGTVGSAEEVITYSYRFSGDDVDRAEIVLSQREYQVRRRQQQQQQHRHHRYHYNQLPPPPNSQSTSPVTTGSSPDGAHLGATAHTTSPASPAAEYDYFDEEDMMFPVSILRSSSQGHPAKKSVQWVSDGKRKPEDISLDRKVVKNQVHCV
jgi:hypothetical protein